MDMEEDEERKEALRSQRRLAELQLPYEQTTAAKIWADIQNHDLQMYSLPDQLVSKFCVPIRVEPTRLFLKFTTPVVLSFLEAAFSTKYAFELIDHYIVVSPKEPK